jgi:hypothetical protein
MGLRERLRRLEAMTPEPGRDAPAWPAARRLRRMAEILVTAARRSGTSEAVARARAVAAGVEALLAGGWDAEAIESDCDRVLSHFRALGDIPGGAGRPTAARGVTGDR